MSFWRERYAFNGTRLLVAHARRRFSEVDRGPCKVAVYIHVNMKKDFENNQYSCHFNSYTSRINDIDLYSIDNFYLMNVPILWGRLKILPHY